VAWGVAGRILWAWVLTIPASGTVALLIYLATRGLMNLAG
jgi:PiT family inorganic phosphate transporter